MGRRLRETGLDSGNVAETVLHALRASSWKLPCQPLDEAVAGAVGVRRGLHLPAEGGGVHLDRCRPHALSVIRPTQLHSGSSKPPIVDELHFLQHLVDSGRGGGQVPWKWGSG
eukprot:EG_transcript_50058